MLTKPLLPKNQFKVEEVNPWPKLATLDARRGSIQSLTVDHDRWRWVKEEVEAVKISITSLHINGKVKCRQDEDVKILATVLAVAQEWRITEQS